MYNSINLGKKRQSKKMIMWTLFKARFLSFLWNFSFEFLLYANVIFDIQINAYFPTLNQIPEKNLLL